MEKLTRRLRINFSQAISPPKSAGSNRARPVVIVLDDDPTICLMIKLLLEVAAGVRVIEASTNELALELVASGKIDLLVANLARPSRTDGLKFLESFKAAYPRVPVIIVSGSMDPVTRSLAFKLGAAACVSKLLATSKLLEAVNTVLLPGRLLGPSPRLARRGLNWVQEVERCLKGRWRQQGKLGQ